VTPRLAACTNVFTLVLNRKPISIPFLVKIYKTTAARAVLLGLNMRQMVLQLGTSLEELTAFSKDYSQLIAPPPQCWYGYWSGSS